MTVPTDAQAQRLAHELQQHPDYRILRRLPEPSDFGGEASPNAWRVVVLDTETTGLDPNHAEVIELALARITVNPDTGLPVGPVASYNGLQQPRGLIPPEVTALTGITDAMVQGKTLDHARVAALVDQADWVVAHNAGFDRPFAEACCPALAQHAWVCSWQDMDWGALGRSAKLEALAAATGVFYDAHRALTDVHALMHVLSQPGAHGRTGWQQLAVAARAPSLKLYATGSPFESKDLLKARGYRWDAERRAWWCRLHREAELPDELAWLRQQVYGTRRAQLQFERMDAHQRYSARAGEPGTVALPG